MLAKKKKKTLQEGDLRANARFFDFFCKKAVDRRTSLRYSSIPIGLVMIEIAE